MPSEVAGNTEWTGVRERLLPPAIAGAAALSLAGAVAHGAVVPAITFLGVALYVAFFLAKPTLALLIYVASRPIVDAFVYQSVGPVSAGQLWGAGLILLVLTFLARTAVRQTEGFSFPAPVLFLVAYSFFGLPHGDIGSAVQYELKMASWLLLAVALERVARTAEGQRLVLGAALVSAALVILAIAYAISQNRYGGAYYTTRNSVEENQQPSGFASFAVLSLPFVLACFIDGRKKIVALVLASALSGLVIVSYTRAAMLGLAVILIGIILIALRGRRPSILFAGVAVAAVVVGTVVAFQARIAARFADLANLTSGANAAHAGSGRISYWLAAWNEGIGSVHSLVIGHGAGASFAPIWRATGNWVWPHNDFIEFLYQGGLPLLAAYLMLVAWLFYCCWRLWRAPGQSERARDFGLLGLATVMAFVFMSFATGLVFSAQSSLMMGVLLGIVNGMRRTPGATWLDTRLDRGAEIAAAWSGTRERRRA